MSRSRPKKLQVLGFSFINYINHGARVADPTEDHPDPELNPPLEKKLGVIPEQKKDLTKKNKDTNPKNHPDPDSQPSIAMRLPLKKIMIH